MINSNHYDVIIVGGGPVGIALGIELGLNKVNTLILEKHAQPLKMPRAQSLSARTMELFLRWGADDLLENNLLLPPSLPQTGIWCTTLCGESFFETAWGDNQLQSNASPKAGVRVPIWVTEEVLRKRLADFPTVDFHTEHEVTNIVNDHAGIAVEVYDKKNQSTMVYQADFLACCDGVSGPTKKIFNNTYKPLSKVTPMLGTMFISKELMSLKSVPDGIMYFVLDDGALAFVGPVDLKEGLWLAQIVLPNPDTLPDDAAISTIIDNIVGQPINKKIVDSYLWNMQVQIADFFSLDNRIFWLGDSAHAFAPTGGLGLNTGFGDAYNLGWKLSEVIKKQAPLQLLSTYAQERCPVWQSNLDFAKNNAEEFLEVKKKFPPEIDYKAYSFAYADLGNRYLRSSGLTLGYGYLDSPLTQLLPNQKNKNNPFEYEPKVEPGYFLPHVIFQNTTIYNNLSPTQWNLIISKAHSPSVTEIEALQQSLGLNSIHIVDLVAENLYPFAYLLIRPDWHIARVGNHLADISGSIQESYLCT